jgi:hypothetical protein
MKYCPECGGTDIENYDDEYTCLSCDAWWKATIKPLIIKVKP